MTNQFKVGDKFKYTAKTSTQYYTQGNVYQIREIDGDTINMPDNEGNNHYWCYERLSEKFEPVGPTKKQRIEALETNVTVLAQDAEVYKMRIAELERQLAAQKGDYDRVMKLADEWARLKDTAQRVVDGAHYTTVPITGDNLKVGDEVIAVELGGYNAQSMTNGHIYKVTKVDSDGDFHVIEDDGTESVIIVCEEFAQFAKVVRDKKATKPDMPPFEIGDKVRLTTYISCYLSNGSVYEVIGVINAKGSNGEEFVILDDDGDKYYVDADKFDAFEKAETADA